MAYALQQTFKDDLDELQKQQIIVSLAVDKTPEWCNTFVLMPKPNRKVRLWLEPTRLNQALIMPVYSSASNKDPQSSHTYIS